MSTLTVTEKEIFSQPQMWQQAQELGRADTALAQPGESIAVIGCGTSWFMAQSYCRAREVAGQGVSDAYTATEFPLSRDYDRVICLSRSGTTTEIVDIMRELHGRSVPTVLITAVSPGPGSDYANQEVTLDFADEESVVQTRFATSALVYMLTSLGEDLTPAIHDCQEMLQAEIPQRWIDAPQISFLGTGWTIGLATEAGLKLREASQSWTECYPAMEYRHGPISIAEPGRLVWIFGEVPTGLEKQVADTGAELVTSSAHPLAHLVLAQRLAVARAQARGLNPDQPRHLTRSVILEAPAN